ncbi:acyltransferase [Maritimibacter sp. DP07]|uniref:Acyltransferase n=2 Tax=Maritimibacter harenae TaxID=2606218 RepID=A0A845M497_9RHOB|nr:acyltransferase [Maritimibacter harenae]
MRRRLKIADLRLRGVLVDSSAAIHPGAIIEPSGGKIVIGARTFIDHGVILRGLGGTIEIGDDCSVNAYSVLQGGGNLRVGNDTRIASHTVIVPSNHVFSDPDIPIRDQGLRQEGILIEGDVWIGAGARVLDGVVLGKGCIVAAGAVVTGSVAPGTIVGGVPARTISVRGKDD